MNTKTITSDKKLSMITSIYNAYMTQGVINRQTKTVTKFVICCVCHMAAIDHGE